MTCEKWLRSGLFTDVTAFWQTTLYDMLLLIRGMCDVRTESVQMQNVYNGNILAMLLNVAPRKSRKVFSWTDFYPDIRIAETKGKEMTDEEIGNTLHSMFPGGA